MRKLSFILVLVLILALAVLAIVADLPMGRELQSGLDLGVYLKLASLFSLIIAASLAWGYKRQVEASQKYRRADEALAQAEVEVARKLKALEATEARLKESFVQKEQGIDQQVGHATAELQQRISILKQQNLELKETVAKLMQTLKQQRQKNN